jgi:hypothetical protein
MTQGVAGTPRDGDAATQRRSDAATHTQSPTRPPRHRTETASRRGRTLADGGCTRSPAVVRHASSCPICIRRPRAADEGGARSPHVAQRRAEASTHRSAKPASQRGTKTPTQSQLTHPPTAATHRRRGDGGREHATSFLVYEAAPGRSSTRATRLVSSADVGGSVRREAGPGQRPARPRCGAAELNQYCGEFSTAYRFIGIVLFQRGALRLFHGGQRRQQRRMH